MGRVPKVFLSYAWEGGEAKAWVKSLAARLREDGVESILDQWETVPGDHLSSFMERAVRDSDFVVVVCTPTYKAKSDKGLGGVGYEGSIMSAEVVTGTSRRKFIPILRHGAWTDAAPSWLLGSFYIDFTDTPVPDSSYRELLDTVLDRREKAPPVGTPLADSDPIPPRTIDLPDEPPTEEKLATTEPSVWPYVWKQLMDQSPGDIELIYIAKNWLYRNQDQKSWSFVWEELARKNVYDEELRQLAVSWLIKNEFSPGWAFVWRRLAELNPEDAEISRLGKNYLSRAE